MEIPLSASGEVKHPARTIPRALAMGMVSVTLLYVAIQIIAQGILGPALANSTEPLADAMASRHTDAVFMAPRIVRLDPSFMLSPFLGTILLRECHSWKYRSD